MYHKFIYDIIVIWNGDEGSLRDFMEKLNDNQKMMSLSWEMSSERINFLYLEIIVQQDDNWYLDILQTDR